MFKTVSRWLRIVSSVVNNRMHRRQIDAFVARNHEALNESIAQSRAEVTQGIYSKRTVAEIIADGRKRFETAEQVANPDRKLTRPTKRPAN